jgi:ribosomal protein S12 methylthiotransferase
MKIGIITVGCDKNTVDNEYLAGLLRRRGHEVFRPQAGRSMDALVITTCGFIEDAKRQSIETIIEWAELRRRHKRRYRIIVAGCLGQLYGSELSRAIPEIDSIVGVCNPDTLLNAVENCVVHSKKLSLVSSRPALNIEKYYPRHNLDILPYSFLRISDGCNYRCSFCSIPRMKGKYRSVPIDIVLKEARALLRRGVKEINIIGQDITRYGADIKGGYGLVDLLKALCSLRGKFWVRLLYLYPSGLSKALIKFIQNEPKICKYIDIPLQHLSPRVLRLMRRPTDIEKTLKTLRDVRRIVPEVKIRTTMIVGFPGEGKSDFNLLKRGVEEFGFDRLGLFAFSAEPFTAAVGFKNQVPARIKNKRRDEIMRLQADISRNRNLREVGKVCTVLLEDRVGDTDIYTSRSEGEAPEVDGFVLVKSKRDLCVGSFMLVRIIGASEYDLFAEPC